VCEYGIAPVPAAVSRELEHHLRYPGVVLENLLDLLKERDGALVIEHLPESNNERGGFVDFGDVPR